MVLKKLKLELSFELALCSRFTLLELLFKRIYH